MRDLMSLVPDSITNVLSDEQRIELHAALHFVRLQAEVETLKACTAPAWMADGFVPSPHGRVSA